MDEKLRLQQMIERFMAAETSEAEERELAAYFCENDDVPAEWREYAILFRGLGGYRRCAVAPQSKPTRWAVAAAAAVMVAAGAGWWWTEDSANETVEPLAQSTVAAAPAASKTESRQAAAMKHDGEAAERRRAAAEAPLRPSAVSPEPTAAHGETAAAGREAAVACGETPAGNEPQGAKPLADAPSATATPPLPSMADNPELASEIFDELEIRVRKLRASELQRQRAALEEIYMRFVENTNKPFLIL